MIKQTCTDYILSIFFEHFILIINIYSYMLIVFKQLTVVNVMIYYDLMNRSVLRDIFYPHIMFVISHYYMLFITVSLPKVLGLCKMSLVGRLDYKFLILVIF